MEVTSSQPVQELQWRTAALALALPVLGCLALIVVRLSLESGERRALEQVVEVTAVGDLAWYQPPQPEPAAPAAVASYQGQPLVPVSYRHIELRDSRLTFAAMDDAGRLRLYTTRDPVPARNGESERRNEPVYLVKIGPDQYLKVQPAAKGK